MYAPHGLMAVRCFLPSVFRVGIHDTYFQSAPTYFAGASPPPRLFFSAGEFWGNALKVRHSTRRTSPSRSRFRPWFTAMNRSIVSRRMMAFRPTFSTGSLPQSTSFRMVFRPMPVHSAASSMVSPILTALILHASFCCACFATTTSLLYLNRRRLSTRFKALQKIFLKIYEKWGCNSSLTVLYSHSIGGELLG